MREKTVSKMYRHDGRMVPKIRGFGERSKPPQRFWTSS